MKGSGTPDDRFDAGLKKNGWPGPMPHFGSRMR
jgi:hypothetical protein